MKEQTMKDHLKNTNKSDFVGVSVRDRLFPFERSIINDKPTDTN